MSDPRRFGESKRHEAWDKSGWTFYHEPSLPVSEDQTDAIAESLGVAADSKHVAATIAAIRRFDGRERAMPRGDHRARDLETLAALARAMEGVNANVLASLARHGAMLGLQEDPRQVAAAAREAAVEIEQSRRPSKRGRKRLESRIIVLQELSAIYETATDRRATISVTSESGVKKAGKPTGPFFRFMRAATAPYPSLKKLSDYALHAAVKRATKDK